MKHRVDPQLLPALEQFPDMEFTLEALPMTRAILAQMVEIMPPVEPVEGVSFKDRIIKGPDGNEITLRIYRPQAESTLPVLLWIHGGGYVIGTYTDNDALCMRFAKETPCVVVSVDYRLAPEHPYPAPLEDCYAALKWIADNADELNISKDKIGVAGASAGGGLTAALTLLARDRKYPKLHFQMPLYPMIDDKNNSPSVNEILEGFVWNKKSNEAGWRMYLGELYGTDNIPPYAAAARAVDYSNLPYTYVCVGQLDPFRDENITYVTKLAQAGVDVEFHLYPGAYHSFEMATDADVTIYAVNEYVNAVKKGLTR